ncbi:hypothetical protein TWF730_003540 [Orbilia blumenaviensis]|uniref:Essential protein Yae1 N-terminal domain-containing protein n=1 Tax=Orbilia blumenaviensis TaxID=1796055 RepID=A0AAV9U390_9PEZI
MTDLLDSVLNLEEEYYTLGHQEGSLAAAKTGRLEGRAFGIETAFQKYLTLGVIKGRTKVWSSRSSISPTSTSESETKMAITNPRHIKHLELLQTLTTTPPIRNEEEDVEEVDDRIRRGKAKVKILENTLKEGVPDDDDDDDDDDEDNNYNDNDSKQKGKKKGSKKPSGIAISGATGLETEFEDFKIRKRS